jgi:hypothetical protein
MATDADCSLYSDEMQKLASVAREKIASAEQALLAKLFAETIDKLANNPTARTTIVVKTKTTWIDTLTRMFAEAGVWFQPSHTTECRKYVDTEAFCNCSGYDEIVYEVSMTRNLPRKL